MPVLNNGRLNIEGLCESNQIFLGERGLIDVNREDVNLGRLNPEEQKNILNQLKENEKINAQSTEANYQKGKYQAKHIILLLTTALALLGAGFVLAPLLITSSLILPIVPFLLFSVAFVAFTNFCLNIKTSRLGNEANHAANILNQLEECKAVGGNAGEEMISTSNNVIRHINSQTETVREKIGELEEKTTYNFSLVMTKLGMFPPTTPIPIPVNESASANELHNMGRVSPTHS
jgi:hypothetical protein